MTKTAKKRKPPAATPRDQHDDDNGRTHIDRESYQNDLYALQVELVKLQRRIIERGGKVLIVLEGRDAAGKDGAIKRVTEHLSPRETRIVALPKPSDREQSEWYYQRFVQHLPAASETVFFNRSWYNRAGVERVMGFCSKEELQDFFETAPVFEGMLVRSGIRLIKYYLDVSKLEQKRRLDARRRDPLKQWKISPIDAAAQSKWKAYSRARNEMLALTHTAISPWMVVKGDDKRAARLNLIRDILSRFDYPKKDHSLAVPDPQVVFHFEDRHLTRGGLYP